MKKEDLFDAVTNLPDKYVKEAKKRKIPRWTAAVAAVLTAVILLGIFFGPGVDLGRGGVQVLAAAEYPQMAAYPNELKYIKWNGEFDDEAFQQVYDRWRDDLNALRPEEGFADGLETYFPTAARALLSGQGNRVCSPLNVYMALAMLAEITDGDTRQEILAALGSDDLEDLRTQAKAVWRSVYRQDGAVNSVLANSLWLNEGSSFRQETVDLLAENYYASVYRGEMGSDGWDQALRDWLDEQTGGLLKEYTANIELDPNAILALAATIYFRVKWQDEFWEDRNTEDLFHGASGDVTAEFMHQSGTATYYWGDSFSAYGKRFEEGGTMWFLLPDQGVSVDALLEDAQAMEFLYQPGSWENQKYLIVNFSMPKFDVSSRLDLSTGLKALGVTDVFDMVQADFSPMTDEPYIHLSEAIHAARVKVDEEGVEAAAFTIIPAPGAAPPPEEEVDFVLDRPFLFAITSETGQLLFVGVVNLV